MRGSLLSTPLQIISSNESAGKGKGNDDSDLIVNYMLI